MSFVILLMKTFNRILQTGKLTGHANDLEPIVKFANRVPHKRTRKLWRQPEEVEQCEQFSNCAVQKRSVCAWTGIKYGAL